MKKIVRALAALVAMMAVSPAFGETFPVISQVVIEPLAGNVWQVSGSQQDVSQFDTLWMYCQDNLRPGCPNNVDVRYAEDGGTYRIFKLDDKALSDGQVAGNFTNANGGWLHLPNCNVKLKGCIKLGNSYRDPNIPNSGGAMLVNTSTGAPVQYPLSMEGACGESYAPAPPIAAMAPPRSAQPRVTAAPSYRLPAPKKYVRRADGSMCEAPCIQEILANTRESVQLDREIKADTTQIRQDTKEIRKDVKEVKHDVKYTKKYVRKTYKKVSQIRDSVGNPKDKKTTLHEKIDRIEQKLGTAPKTQKGGK